jgi:hypothetical protein
MQYPFDRYVAFHRNNIRRYRRLLRTQLTDIERQYIQRRLKEEKAALSALQADPIKDQAPSRMLLPAAYSPLRPDTALYAD